MLIDPGITLAGVVLFWGVVWALAGIGDRAWGTWMGTGAVVIGTSMSISLASTESFLAIGFGRAARVEGEALRAAEIALMDRAYQPLMLTCVLCVLFAVLVLFMRRRARSAQPIQGAWVTSLVGALCTCGPALLSGFLLGAFHIGFMTLEPSAISATTGLVASRLLAVAILLAWIGILAGMAWVVFRGVGRFRVLRASRSA